MFAGENPFRVGDTLDVVRNAIAAAPFARDTGDRVAARAVEAPDDGAGWLVVRQATGGRRVRASYVGPCRDVQRWLAVLQAVGAGVTVRLLGLSR